MNLKPQIPKKTKQNKNLNKKNLRLNKSSQSLNQNSNSFIVLKDGTIKRRRHKLSYKEIYLDKLNYVPIEIHLRKNSENSNYSNSSRAKTVGNSISKSFNRLNSVKYSNKIREKEFELFKRKNSNSNRDLFDDISSERYEDFDNNNNDNFIDNQKLNKKNNKEMSKFEIDENNLSNISNNYYEDSLNSKKLSNASSINNTIKKLEDKCNNRKENRINGNKIINKINNKLKIVI